MDASCVPWKGIGQFQGPNAIKPVHSSFSSLKTFLSRKVDQAAWKRLICLNLIRITSHSSCTYEIPPVFSNFVNIGWDCSCLVTADTAIRMLVSRIFPRISFLPNDPIPLYLCTAAHKAESISPSMIPTQALPPYKGRQVSACSMHA